MNHRDKPADAKPDDPEMDCDAEGQPIVRLQFNAKELGELAHALKSDPERHRLLAARLEGANHALDLITRMVECRRAKGITARVTATGKFWTDGENTNA